MTDENASLRNLARRSFDLGVRTDPRRDRANPGRWLRRVAVPQCDDRDHEATEKPVNWRAGTSGRLESGLNLEDVQFLRSMHISVT